MKVRKGKILRNKYDPYYKELSNINYILEELSANPSQSEKPTGTHRQFKISSDMRQHKKKNDKRKKYIIANKDNVKVLIDVAIELSEDERNVMDKHNTTKGQQVTIDETPTNKHKKQSTREVRTWGMHSAQQPAVPSTASHVKVSTYTSETTLPSSRTFRTIKQQR